MVLIIVNIELESLSHLLRHTKRKKIAITESIFVQGESSLSVFTSNVLTAIRLPSDNELTEQPFSKYLYNMQKVKTFLIAAILVGPLSCSTLQNLANLKKMDFHISGVSDTVLNGISLDDVRSFDNLSASDGLKLLQGVTRKSLPLQLTLNVSGNNPSDNNVVAKLVKLDWTMFMQGKETVSGTFNEIIEFSPGASTNIPVAVELDLFKFFSSNARELFNLAANLSGIGGEPTEIYLTARPTISTIIGPITYPNDITIVRKTVGAN